VTDDVSCRKWLELKAGVLLETNNGCKILANKLNATVIVEQWTDTSFHGMYFLLLLYLMG